MYLILDDPLLIDKRFKVCHNLTGTGPIPVQGYPQRPELKRIHPTAGTCLELSIHNSEA